MRQQQKESQLGHFRILGMPLYPRPKYKHLRFYRHYTEKQRRSSRE